MATRFFYDGYENGLGNWTIHPDCNFIDYDYSHSGTCCLRTPGGQTSPYGIVWRSFTHPATDKFFLRFYFMLRNTTEGCGKLGRFEGVSGNVKSGMELWYDTTSCTTGIVWGLWVNGVGQELAGQWDARWPSNSVNVFNVWHKYELFIEYNTPGSANGRLRLWIDRTKGLAFESANAYRVLNIQNCEFRTASYPLTYTMLDLPTNLWTTWRGNHYQDDVEFWDDLPDTLDEPGDDYIGVRGGIVLPSSALQGALEIQEAPRLKLDGSRYYWRVRVANDALETTWSPAAYFEMMREASSTAQLASVDVSGQISIVRNALEAPYDLYCADSFGAAQYGSTNPRGITNLEPFFSARVHANIAPVIEVQIQVSQPDDPTFSQPAAYDSGWVLLPDECYDGDRCWSLKYGA